MNSSNLAPKIKTRTSLFYGRWPWCLRGYQTEFFCLRVLDHGRIDRIIDNRREWGRRINLRQPGSWYWSDLNITDQDVQNLHAMCDFLMEEQRPHKLVIAGSWFYLYTDDRSLIADMASLPWLDPDRIEITQVQLEGQPNTLIRRQARYRNRSYFRSLLLDDARRQSLVRVLQNQDHIRLGPSLQRWLDHPKWSRTLDYHFIDHDDSSILTLLALIEPRLIRRTLPIVAHK